MSPWYSWILLAALPGLEILAMIWWTAAVYHHSKIRKSRCCPLCHGYFGDSLEILQTFSKCPECGGDLSQSMGSGHNGYHNRNQ